MTTRAHDLAAFAARAAESKGGTEILMIDVGDLLGICEYFVIVTASNTLMVKAIVDKIEVDVAADFDEKPRAVEGADVRRWVLLDYADVVVHVFLSEERDFYRIERLYSDAPQHDWKVQ